MGVLDALFGRAPSPPTPTLDSVLGFSGPEQGSSMLGLLGGLGTLALRRGAEDTHLPGVNMTMNTAAAVPQIAGGVVSGAINAASLPGDVYTGKTDPMSEEGIGRATSLAGFLGGSGLTMPKPANSLGSAGGGFKAYHGSPHSFDKFDLSKIGTGEGNQAYGHGLYFAEDEGVARNYRDQLSKRDADLTINGQGFRRADLLGDYRDAYDHIKDVGGSIDMARQEARDAVSKKLMQGDMDGADFWMRRANTLEYMRDNRFALGGSGHMYEVGVGNDPEHFLDWNKPLGEQHTVTQQHLAKLGYKPEAHGGMLGAEFHSAIGREFTPQESALALHRAGIPGIRYLDAASRGAEGGTRNYVVFDDKTIEILRKYGLAGLGIGGGAALGLSGAQSNDAQAAPR